MPLAHVEFSAAERASGRGDEAKLARAAAALASEGVVVLRSAAPAAGLDALRRRMERDMAHATAAGWEFDDNWQGLRPPYSREYLLPDVIFNRLALAVSERALGPGQRLSGYQANTAFAAGSAVLHGDSPNREYAMAGSREQRVHVDHCNAHPPPHPPDHCTFIVANIPLCDVDCENGATAVFPRTHLDCRCSAGTKFPTPEMLVGQEECRVVTKRGDIVLRDMRLWCVAADRIVLSTPCASLSCDPRCATGTLGARTGRVHIA